MLSLSFKKFLIGFLVVAFLFQATTVFALEIKYPKIPGTLAPQEVAEKIATGEIPKEDVLPLYFKYILNLSLIIVTLFCIAVIIYGGLLYLLSPAKPVILVSAKRWITSGLMGLLILFCSYAILFAINPELTLFRLTREEAEIGRRGPAVLPKEFVSVAYVPSGKIVEEILDRIEETTTTERGERKVLVNKIENIIKEIKEKSDNLKIELGRLKVLTDQCTCGTSNCKPKIKVSLRKTECWCSPDEKKPCDIHCNKKAITDQMSTVATSISALKVAQMKLVSLQLPIIIDYLELKTAGMFMSLVKDLIDYSQFVYLRTTLREDEKKEVKPEVALLGWPEIQLTIESQIGKIENWAKETKKATTTNESIADNISVNTAEVKKQVETINQKITTSAEAINLALEEKTKEKIGKATTTIESLLKIDDSDQGLEKIDALTGEIKSQAEKLELVEYTKEKILGAVKEIKKFLERIGDRVKEIESLKNGIITSTDIREKLDKLKEIKNKLADLRSYLVSIWEKEFLVSDPLSFYYDPTTWENQQVKKETGRLNPLIIFSDSSPAEINKMLADVLIGVLATTTIFELPEEKWNDIINEALAEGASVAFSDFLGDFSDALAEKLKTQIVEETVGENCPADLSQICHSHLKLAKCNNVPIPARRAPELQELLNCIGDKIFNEIEETKGICLPPPALRDETKETPDNSDFCYGSIFTFDHINQVCNYTRGNPICSPVCSHSHYSCHYGGERGTAGALAVDFGEERKFEPIKKAALACGVPENRILLEVDHIHISHPLCDGL
ncbi:MAG: hypothetical protein QMC93_00320 [Patescibacteria group bacterium]|nr:hypothetical protein [Patescibacteria group bacterium]